MKVRAGLFFCIASLLIIPSVLLANPSRSDDRTCSIAVRVTREASASDYKLGVVAIDSIKQLPDVFDLSVPKGTVIAGRGRGASVHDIKMGDILCIDGRIDGRTVTTTRISVVKKYGPEGDYRYLKGIVLKTDPADLKFTVETARGRLTVYADRSRVWHENSVVDVSRLRSGQEIAVRGNIAGDKMDAERVDILG